MTDGTKFAQFVDASADQYGCSVLALDWGSPRTQLTGKVTH